MKPHKYIDKRCPAQKVNTSFTVTPPSHGRSRKKLINSFRRAIVLCFLLAAIDFWHVKSSIGRFGQRIATCDRYYNRQKLRAHPTRRTMRERELSGPCHRLTSE